MGYQVPIGQPFKVMDAVAGTPPVTGTSYALAGSGQAKMIGWSTKFASAPSAVDIKIQFSLDDDIWEDLDESTATAGELRICPLTPANFIRAVLVSQTGGGAATVKVVVTL